MFVGGLWVARSLDVFTIACFCCYRGLRIERQHTALVAAHK